MKRLAPILLVAVLLFSGCSHHYRRALPVAAPAPAPVRSTAATTNAPPVAAPDVPVEKPPLSEATPPMNHSGPEDTTGLSGPGELKPTETLVPPPTPPPPKPDVVLTTPFGRIIIALDDSAAPRTCANFRKLASEGFYNHTVFHRVIPNFMIQGGDPNSRTLDRNSYGLGGPGYGLPEEIRLKHVRGAVAMARLPDSVNPHRVSNGSQFYICVADCPSLDGQYTVFGHVTTGMEVVDRISTAARDARDNPTERIEMESGLQPVDAASHP